MYVNISSKVKEFTKRSYEIPETFCLFSCLNIGVFS